VKLSRQERAALVLLDVFGPSFANDLYRASFGLFLTWGSVFPVLRGLERRGLVDAERVRHLYTFDDVVAVFGNRDRVPRPVAGIPRTRWSLTPKARVELALLRERWGRA
jgi:hypothetical protein